jgi:hypothetical protein
MPPSCRSLARVYFVGGFAGAALLVLCLGVVLSRLAPGGAPETARAQGRAEAALLQTRLRLAAEAQIEAYRVLEAEPARLARLREICTEAERGQAAAPGPFAAAETQFWETLESGFLPAATAGGMASAARALERLAPLRDALRAAASPLEQEAARRSATLSDRISFEWRIAAVVLTLFLGALLGWIGYGLFCTERRLVPQLEALASALGDPAAPPPESALCIELEVLARAGAGARRELLEISLELERERQTSAHAGEQLLRLREVLRAPERRSTPEWEWAAQGLPLAQTAAVRLERLDALIGRLDAVIERRAAREANTLRAAELLPVAATAAATAIVGLRAGEEALAAGAGAMRDETVGVGDALARVSAELRAAQEKAAELATAAAEMTQLSRQTGLLAVNAGVEAARAGAFGLGFAVIAREVKALSERSAEATERIAALIAGLRGAARDAAAIATGAESALARARLAATEVGEAAPARAAAIDGAGKAARVTVEAARTLAERLRSGAEDGPEPLKGCAAARRLCAATAADLAELEDLLVRVAAEEEAASARRRASG